jgi:predicted phage tail protein
LPFFLGILVNLFVSLVIGVIAYALMPKAKMQQSDATRDFDSPTAEGGRPIPVVFGEMTVTGLNYLGTSQKQTIVREI